MTENNHGKKNPVISLSARRLCRNSGAAGKVIPLFDKKILEYQEKHNSGHAAMVKFL